MPEVVAALGSAFSGLMGNPYFFVAIVAASPFMFFDGVRRVRQAETEAADKKCKALQRHTNSYRALATKVQQSISLSAKVALTYQLREQIDQMEKLIGQAESSLQQFTSDVSQKRQNWSLSPRENGQAVHDLKRGWSHLLNHITQARVAAGENSDWYVAPVGLDVWEAYDMQCNAARNALPPCQRALGAKRDAYAANVRQAEAEMRTLNGQ